MDTLQRSFYKRDPALIAEEFETLGRWCGVGIISKEMREKHFYLKLP